ncbi:MAG: TauD/TfdA family dioxygenase, partial [Planctomycetales bacterium]|nr:TauD/TfdA family dioxygenase [Planctomycetales bacterium]
LLDRQRPARHHPVGAEEHQPDPPDDVIAEIHDALMTYQVVFFRDQKFDHEAHKAFGRRFGGLFIHNGVAGIPGHDEIVAIHADENSKYVAGDNWHSDLTINAEPPMGSILYMHTLPPVGGDTLWSSMYAAYDALSDQMKAHLDTLTAIHDGEHVYRPIINDPTKTYPSSVHPVVRVHPVTRRKAIFVNASYTTRIVELPKSESDALLSFLYAHCQDPNFQCRFKWRPHSVAFWDNRCTQHFAVYDYYPNVRSGFRVTVAGDKPLGVKDV